MWQRIEIMRKNLVKKNLEKETEVLPYIYQTVNLSLVEKILTAKPTQGAGKTLAKIQEVFHEGDKVREGENQTMLKTQKPKFPEKIRKKIQIKIATDETHNGEHIDHQDGLDQNQKKNHNEDVIERFSADKKIKQQVRKEAYSYFDVTEDTDQKLLEEKEKLHQCKEKEIQRFGIQKINELDINLSRLDLPQLLKKYENSTS